MLRNLQEYDSSYSDSLFVRIIACRLCCTRNTRRKKFDEIQPLDNMEFLDMLGEGGFGRVFRCRDVKANRIVAVKQISILDTYDAVPGSIIREVSFLKELNHPNIVRLLNVMNRKGTRFVNLVFEYLDCDLNDYIRDNERYGSSINDHMTRKSFLYQILSAVEYCHSHKVIHRDLKPRNLLIDHSQKIIKLADFGLARELGDPDMLYTEKVATRWYRAPEILFECGQYSTPIDIWSVGCIFGEMVLGQPILRAIECKDELETIFRMFGTPTEETWPGVTKLCANLQTYPKFKPMDLSTIFSALDPTGLNLLTRMLCLDPSKRISAEAALRHAYFDDLDPSVRKKMPMTIEGGSNNIAEEFVTTMEGGSSTTKNKAADEFVNIMEDGSSATTNNNEDEFAMTLEGGKSPTTNNNNAEEFAMTFEGGSSINKEAEFVMTMDGGCSSTTTNNTEAFLMTMEDGGSSTNNNNAEEFAVGCLLSIRTIFGDEFEGQVVTFDSPSNILALMDGSKDSCRRNIRLLKANYIKDFTFLGQSEDPLDPHNCYLDLNDLQAREELAIRQAEAKAERIGVGVTSEAQNIFDALSKTHPVRWDKTDIVVMNDVRISSPYHSGCVIGGAPAANDRVKKVLDMLRKSLQLPGSGDQ